MKGLVFAGGRGTQLRPLIFTGKQAYASDSQQANADLWRVEAEEVSGWWKDSGRPEDLLESNQLILSDLVTKFEDGSDVSEQAHLTGNIMIGSGSRVLRRANIRGPAIVGRNCIVGPNTYIGPYTAVGDDCSLRSVEIENSIREDRVQQEDRRQPNWKLLHNFEW